MDKLKAQDLLNKYLNGSCTDEEKLLVESWYNKLSRESDLPSNEPNWELNRQEILSRLPISTEHRKISYGRYYAAAAMVIFVLSIGVYLYLRPNNKPTEYANDILPGVNKAILILANGRKITLDNHKGDLAKESNVKIAKLSGGQIIYTINGAAGSSSVPEYNTVETPNGGQYIITLPDGTKVWLNAASSLKYPTNFSGGVRSVTLKGEAYFEVAHNKAKPFIVKTSQQSVQVLGTHFNVNAYADEASTNTTLLQGKVEITTGGMHHFLAPGQESVVVGQTHQISVHPADLEGVMAWKNGDFVFKEEPLESIMRKVSRWYDVVIIYENNAPRNLTLGGWISRSKNISAVLKIMELTGKVHFKVSGRRVTVMQ